MQEGRGDLWGVQEWIGDLWGVGEGRGDLWGVQVSGLEKVGSVKRGISNEGCDQHNWFFIIKFRNSIQVHTMNI